jgi:hypothetical protein
MHLREKLQRMEGEITKARYGAQKYKTMLGHLYKPTE